MHEDIQYFAYKKRKGQLLALAMKDKRKDRATNLFNKVKQPFLLNILCFFVKLEEFLPGSEEPSGCSVPTRFTTGWLFGWLVGWLVVFYGISTFVGYLTPNPFLCK